MTMISRSILNGLVVEKRENCRLVVEKRENSSLNKKLIILNDHCHHVGSASGSGSKNPENSKKPVATNEYTLETRDASPSHLLTKISSLSLLSKHKIGVFESMKFEAGDYKWKVTMNLDGDDKDMISVKLCMVGISSLAAGWEVNAIFTFFLYNHISDKYHCFRGKARRFHAINPECELSKLITKECLREASNGFVSDDKCVFGAEVFVIEKQPSIENLYKGELDLSKSSKLECKRKPIELSARGNTWNDMIYPKGSLRACRVDSKASVFGKKAKAAAASLFCISPKAKTYLSNEVKDHITSETRDAPPAHLLTLIESFSMLSKHKIKLLESTEFEIGDCKWKVKINLDEDSNISVYLCIVETSFLPEGWEVNAIFNFFLFNHIADKYHCFRGKARRFHAMNPEWGFSKFISKKELTDPSNGYLSNNKCVFGAEVFVIQNQPLIEKVSVLRLSYPYKREWKISKFSKLQSMWKSKQFSVGGYKWKIKVYPNGCKGMQGYVSIFLESVDAKNFGDHIKVKAEYTLCFRNKLNSKENCSMKVEKKWFSSTSVDWGFDQFIARSEMHDPSKGFVVDDCCTVEIQISVLAVQELV